MSKVRSSMEPSGKWLGWLILLITCFQGNIFAQEYSYAQYSAKDGLAGSVVYCAAEDKDGFLWFGTETGLSRFDGTRFSSFTTSDGLPDNEVLRMFIDSKNRIWIFPFTQSLCYYYKGKIHNAQNDSLLAKVSIGGEVIGMAEDDQGNIVFASQKKAYLITGNTIRQLQFPIGQDAGFVAVGLNHEHRIQFVCNDKPDYITLITLRKDFTGALNDQPADIWGMFKTTGIFPHMSISRIKDSLAFSWDQGRQQSRYALPAGYSGYSCLNDSVCAINSRSGTVLFNYRTRKEVRRCLADKAVNNVFIDSEGNYWFMTAGAGVLRVGSFGFRSYLSDLKLPEDETAIFSVRQFGDTVYAGSARSIYWIIDPHTFQKKEQRLSARGINTRVVCMESYNGSGVIFGTDDGAVVEGMGKPLHTSLNLAVKSINIYGDSFLLASNVGPFLVGRDLKIDKHVLRKRITASVVHKGIMYFGTLDGLYAVDSLRRLQYLGDLSPVLRSRISSLHVSADGTLWLATSGHGVAGYKEGLLLTQITEKDGLSSNICRAVFASGNDLWVGTDKGLNRIKHSSNQNDITVFTRVDGLLSDIINAVFVKDGHVYVGTSAGLTYFNADSISVHSFCKLRITGFLANDSERLYLPDGFSLPHASNDIRINYVGISYRSAGNITYRYRLSGLNDEWQTTRDTYLSFPSLPSGSYELQIMAINKFGVKSELVLLPFSIQTLLWERTWFRVVAVLLIALVVTIWVSSRINKIKKQNEERNQITARMTELEQMALKAQMNPHFIFNSLNSLQHYVIEKDVLGANKFIIEFSRLIRLTLDISTKLNISIYEEISYLTTYLELEKTKFEDKFSYEVSIDKTLNPSEWSIPPMILQPYVENSIRHGVRGRRDKNGHIIVHFSKDDHHLICIVEDNGVGREVAARYKSQMPIEYQSKGMSLTAKRIDMLNRNHSSPVLITIEDLHIDSHAAGTRVTIRFPLSQAAKF